ncbi:MAG TPA: two-component regulator propeller domain-containing protein, partial [Chitinophagaceae bacterium]
MLCRRSLAGQLLFIAMLCEIVASGQAYMVSPLPVEKDLSSRQVSAIFQDHRGFMWIGTEDGLNFYNANSVTVFKHDFRNKASLLDNDIQSICEDDRGMIWIATASGVDRLDPATDTFSHYSADKDGHPFGFKPKVYADRSGKIWIGRDGLFRQLAGGGFQRIHNDYADSLLRPGLANLVNGFFQDSKGRYWISTYDGLFLFNAGNDRFTRVDAPPTDENYRRFGILFGQVCEDRNGVLRAGTWGYGVFNVLPPDGVRAGNLQRVSESGVILSYSTQRLGGQEVFWYGNDGLTSLDRQDHRVMRLTHQNDDPFSLRKDAIRVLFTDKQNQLWIGYEKSGIQIISPGNLLVQNHTVLSPGHDISSVGVITGTRDGYYIGGWYKDALCKLNRSYRVIKWWPFLPSSIRNSSSNVGDIYPDGNMTWVATANGLVSIDERNGSMQQYTLDTAISKRSFFLRILPEGDSVLWLPGYDNGLTRFSIRTKKMELFGARPLPFFWKALFDGKGKIWCANNSGFIERFDPGTHQF